MELVELLQQFGIEYLGRYYSSYRGVVINNTDEDNQQKIQVVIPEIKGGLKVWARPKGIQGGPLYGFKNLTPLIGEVVMIEFECGDLSRPLWVYNSWAMGECPEELQKNNTIGLVTPKGQKIYLQDDDGLLKILTNEKIDIEIADGCTLTMDKDKVVVNGGSNRGVMNIEIFEKFVDAVLKDLMIVPSGQNVSKWMATEMPKLEDTKFEH